LGKGKSHEEIAKDLRFDSVEEMRTLLQSWDLPGWVVGEVSNSDENRPRGKTHPRLRNFGPGTELPSAGNATDLFKERLEALLKSAELLKHMGESLHGRYFVRQDVETASLLASRDHFPEEEWKVLSERYGFDPDDQRFWLPNAVTLLPGGVALSPQETEAILIGVYALAGGDMDALVDTLRPLSSSADAETREEVRQYVEGSRADGDNKDGLKMLALQLAIWVRGSKVRPGRPAGLSKADHALACRITHLREQGITDEEIARKESHRKKEDGTSYTTKDVTELGNLGLSWP